MLSIIIPTLNEEKNLPNLLESIKSQEFNDYEVIVSDAKSIDKTKEIALKSNCLFISSEIKHPSHQRNQGAKLAKGEILLFLDADSTIPENFLNIVMNDFKERNLVGAGLYLKFNSKKKIYLLYNKVYNFFCYISQFFKPLAVGAAIISQKEAHFKMDGFDETILVGEDHDYVRRIKKLGKFRMIKNIFFYYSPRRWEKEGHALTIYKLFIMFIYIVFKGPIRKKIVKYEFGHY